MNRQWLTKVVLFTTSTPFDSFYCSASIGGRRTAPKQYVLSKIQFQLSFEISTSSSIGKATISHTAATIVSHNGQLSYEYLGSWTSGKASSVSIIPDTAISNTAIHASQYSNVEWNAVSASTSVKRSRGHSRLLPPKCAFWWHCSKKSSRMYLFLIITITDS